MSATKACWAVVVVAGGLLVPRGAGAEVSFVITARADAFALELVDTAAPVAPEGQVLYATSSSAQSVLDSVGRSQASAGAPSPGPFFAELPANGNGVLAGFGVPIAFPDYPFVVRSDHPIAPSAKQEQGPSKLKAESTENSSKSDARFGFVTGDDPAVLSSQASTTAAVDPASATRTAMADSRLDGLSVGALVLGRSSAHAKMVKEAGRAPTKESSFTVGSASIAGVEVSFTDHGFKLGPSAPPGMDLSTLLGVLSQQGVTVEFLPANGTETSIESAGLRITRTGTSPTGTNHRLSIILGRVRTSV